MGTRQAASTSTYRPPTHISIQVPGCVLVLLFLVLIRSHGSLGEVSRESLLATNCAPGLGNVQRYDSAALQDLALASVNARSGRHSLTAILPVNEASLPDLDGVLSTLLTFPSRLHEIYVVCPQSVLAQTRNIIRRTVVAVGNSDHPDVSLRSWEGDKLGSAGLIQIAAAEVTTGSILFLDESGLQLFDKHGREILLNPPGSNLPFGPHGILLSLTNVSCVTFSTDRMTQLASYLVPPFVISSSYLLPTMSGRLATWSELGQYVSRSHLSYQGGIVLGIPSLSDAWCLTELQVLAYPEPPINLDVQQNSFMRDELEQTCRIDDLFGGQEDRTGSFVLVFPTLHDALLFSQTACRLHYNGHKVQTFIYGDILGLDGHEPPYGACHLPYNILSSTSQHNFVYYNWHYIIKDTPDVILVLRGEPVASGLERFLDRSSSSTLIQLSRDDLLYTSWISSLSLTELKNWNAFQIDIAVITMDRPRSLNRLLSSLSNARFFGDLVSLRLNLEQNSDPDTLKLVDQYRWKHGAVFVHHRVIHGGLLPAVVESWYPHTNNTYGLLLEDDVELSPLFYAWAKMAILRYRYGEQRNRSPQLFGISLYQQKNIELRLGGREPFNAQTIFADMGLPYPSTPYLSQIPCSWGAVYFPDHWREFHAYLSTRLSEIYIDIDQVVVPNVRSNRWEKSWKKFFIELVFLRGYVMLYPNYDDFVSLSTNHVEVGSHVKAKTRQKRASFLLPLMKLEDGLSPTSGLLNLPEHTLPPWRHLPVLDLSGSLTTLKSITLAGRSRRQVLTACPNEPSVAFDIQDLMCTNDMMQDTG